MPPLTLKYDALLLLTALIWGFAFVAQRVGMDFIGPFTYSAVRFSLGTCVLLPFAIASSKKDFFIAASQAADRRSFWLGGAVAGLCLFAGVSFQQTGLVYTTAGNAGFITGLFVVFVPVFGLLGNHKASLGTWLGAMCAVVGLYFLSVKEGFSVEQGDLLVLCGAVMWALHVFVLGNMAPKTDPLMLACLQFSVCSVLSWLWAIVLEPVKWQSIMDAAVPILYGGVLSVGIAYTLQVVAQRRAHPAHAAIFLSLESVFAAIGGWFFLNETLTLRAFMGCLLMFTGILLSQLFDILRFKKATDEQWG
ncbi:MAG: DMT family transporter [Desulfobacteraceae bacterium]|nr:DMT family transporter [Desulfobacteraceae bacterium]